jgi:glycosyltransferase involved in cell wall biosynthesis
MRIAFDARLLDVPHLRDSGVGRYAACLLEALGSRPGLELVALRDLRRPPAPERLAEGFEHLFLAHDVRRVAADVLHSPALEGISLRPGAPLVVTLHDLVPLKQPARYLRTGLKHRLRWAAVRRAARAITPSRAVAADAERLLGLDPGRVAVIPEAAAPVFRPVPDPRSTLERLRLPERFLLWVGRLDPPDPRKGLELLTHAVREDEGPPLVLAGRAGARGRALADGERVLLAGRLPDTELAALYSAAEALVFPSEEEGFGLPAVEALACGTPVAAYACGALRETLAGVRGAELVEPGEITALLAAAARLAGTPVDRPSRTWADVARETVTVYRDAAT